MKREEKRKKFYDALLNKFYPPSSSLPSTQEQDDNELPESLVLNIQLGGISGEIDLSNAAVNEDEFEDTEKSSSGDDECGVQKLSRSQRKRVRKKKLKGAQSQRRKIIGPLLPSQNDEEDICGLQDVRQFVSQKKCDDATAESSEGVSYPKGNKLRKRRLAKKEKEGSDKKKLDCLEDEVKHHGRETDCNEEEKVVASSV